MQTKKKNKINIQYTRIYRQYCIYFRTWTNQPIAEQHLKQKNIKNDEYKKEIMFEYPKCQLFIDSYTIKFYVGQSKSKLYWVIIKKKNLIFSLK